MKKYDVSSLKVIKLENNNNFRYFICKYSKFKKSYVEIFTNKKMNVCDEKNIFPISLFLSYLDYEGVIILDKKEVLNVYLSINNINNLNELDCYNEPKVISDDINEKLKAATLKFFPKDGAWTSGCFKKQMELNMCNLPCHLRNNVWLALMFEKNQKLSYIKHNEIIDFVNSSFFQEKRHEYELEIVKWQIDWILEEGENWIVDEQYGGEFIYLHPNVDIGIRKGVVDTLTAIGLDRDVIEEGLEKFADRWRNQTMTIAFMNEYDPINVFGSSKNIMVSREHKANWLKLRRYEYYQRHKDSVDLYGSIEPDMLMSSEEVETLKQTLAEKHSEIKGHSKTLKRSYLGW